eukprot:scaffold10199_cov52-Phaeocystis_antarctica.AAC.2
MPSAAMRSQVAAPVGSRGSVGSGLGSGSGSGLGSGGQSSSQGGRTVDEHAVDWRVGVRVGVGEPPLGAGGYYSIAYIAGYCEYSTSVRAWRLLWYRGYYSMEVTMSRARPAVEEQEVTMSRVRRLL